MSGRLYDLYKLHDKYNIYKTLLLVLTLLSSLVIDQLSVSTCSVVGGRGKSRRV